MATTTNTIHTKLTVDDEEYRTAFDRVIDITNDLEKANDGLQSRFEDLQKRMSEFGGTAASARSRLIELEKASDGTAASVARLAKINEELVYEMENSAVGMEHVNAVLRFQGATLLRTEEAVSQYAATMRGETQALQNFGRRGAAVAAAIDKITDPAMRARLATRYLNKELNNSEDAFDRLMNVWAGLEAAFASLGAKGKLIVAGIALMFGTLGAAALALKKTVTFTFDTLAKHGENASESAKELDKTWTKFKFTMAQAFMSGNSLALAMKTINRTLQSMGRWVKANKDLFRGFFKVVLAGAKGATFGIIAIGQGVIGFGIIVADALSAIALASAKFHMKMSEAVEFLAQQMAKLSPAHAKPLVWLSAGLRRVALNGAEASEATAGVSKRLLDMGMALGRTKASLGVFFDLLAEDNGWDDFAENAKKANKTVKKESDLARRWMELWLQTFHDGRWQLTAKELATLPKDVLKEWKKLKTSEKVFHDMTLNMERLKEKLAEVKTEIMDPAFVHPFSGWATSFAMATSEFFGVAENEFQYFRDATEDFINDIADTMVNGLANAAEQAGEALAIFGGKGSSMLDALKKSFGAFTSEMAGGVIAYGKAMLAMEAGWGAGIIAAGIALKFIAGSLSSWAQGGGGANASGSNNSGADRINRLADRLLQNEQENRMGQTFLLQFGSRQIQPMMVEQIRGAMATNSIAPSMPRARI